jgi:ADP-heptose:LPS heptosyltransferase
MAARRDVILDIGFSPGDIVVFTGALRDLKKAHPDMNITVKTCCPAIFENNPHLDRPVGKGSFIPDLVPHASNLNDLGHGYEFDSYRQFRELAAQRKMRAVVEGDVCRYYDARMKDGPDAILFTAPVGNVDHPEPEFVQVQYNDIHNCGWTGRHFSTAYPMHPEEKLGVKIPQTTLYPDLHLSEEEKGWMNQVEDTFGYKGPFWLINAGHKSDYPLKQWGVDNWQALVDLLADRVQFVQVGELTPDEDLKAYEEGRLQKIVHYHPKLNNVLDLRGKTDLRQLIRLCYHAQGAVCGVTALMHMMAAWRKPCVVVSGGREPRRWEQYPMHRFVDTVGWLPCCADNGCWLSGRRKDSAGNKSCVHLAGGRPLCYRLIDPEWVANEVLGYYLGGVL